MKFMRLCEKKFRVLRFWRVIAVFGAIASCLRQQRHRTFIYTLFLSPQGCGFSAFLRSIHDSAAALTTTARSSRRA